MNRSSKLRGAAGDSRSPWSSTTLSPVCTGSWMPAGPASFRRGTRRRAMWRAYAEAYDRAPGQGSPRGRYGEELLHQKGVVVDPDRVFACRHLSVLARGEVEHMDEGLPVSRDDERDPAPVGRPGGVRGLVHFFEAQQLLLPRAVAVHDP